MNMLPIQTILQHLCVLYLALTAFIVFISTQNVPTHNLRPLIPVTSPGINTKNRTNGYFQVPNHNFWPWIPVVSPINNTDEDSYFKIPEHGFWPFFPMVTKFKPKAFNKTITPPLFYRPSRYNYGEVLYKSILFYEAQRSGRLPRTRNIKWRGNAAMDDRGYNGEDLTGGWFDAGDYVKFGVPMATATTLLLWGMIDYGVAYKSAGLEDMMMACVMWPLDYFIKAHTKKYELYGQVADPYEDHTYWGRPEDMKMDRPAYLLSPNSPGSDLVADTSAAMAAGSIAFKQRDKHYARELLEHAKDLFDFAERYRGPYSDSIPSAEEFYRSYTDEDELAWAAVWLYKATRNGYYLERARVYASQMDSCWAQSWADKSCAVSVLLYEITRHRRYRSNVQSFMTEWMPEGNVDYTPKGLAFRGPWGTLRYTANMAFLALKAADLGINTNRYRLWAQTQIDYMLGDGGRSYVVGYGNNPPIRPHHAASSCPSPPLKCSWADYTKPGPNSHVLFGALVGGPDINDHFNDDRTDYIQNEVGTEYNAGFQSAIAALKYLELQTPP